MEQIKTQNLQGYEEYRNGEITRDQFASTKTQLEKEKLNLQKRIQEVENLIGDEKETLYEFLIIFLNLFKCPYILILQAIRAFLLSSDTYVSSRFFTFLHGQSW